MASRAPKIAILNMPLVGRPNERRKQKKDYRILAQPLTLLIRLSHLRHAQNGRHGEVHKAVQSQAGYGARDRMTPLHHQFGSPAGSGGDAAAIHNLPVNETGRPVVPTRAFSALRRSASSSHPASPADAVSPTTPHRGLRPRRCGRCRAATYPSTAVRRTRRTAKRRGVRVSRSA